MIREAPTQNRYVQEAENERQYQKHVNAIKNMKPSINTHAEIKNKDKKSRNPRVRIFNGQAALDNRNQQMASTGPKKEKIIDKNERRPKSGMNYINLEIDIENDNENEVFNNKKHRKANMDLISISESGSGPLDSSKKKDGIDNSNSPDKKDITDFDIFSMNSAKSQAEKEREEITTNRYHPYIPSNSARTKVKTIKPEVQQQPLSAKKSRIPLSRQDNHNNGNNATPPGLKKTSSNGSITKTNIPNTKPKIKVKPKTERSNTNNDDTDNTPNNNVSFNAPKVSSARRKTKNDNNHPHMNQMDKQQMQAQQRQQQRVLKQQQEKIERQERLEKLEKQKKKISAAPSSPQMPSSPSTPINSKSSGAKQTRSSNLGSSSSLSNKKQSSENKKAKNENDDRKLFKTEISLSKTKTQNEKRMCETDLEVNNSNSDSFLPCQPVFTEPTPKVTFGADMWDTSDDEDDDDDEIENIIKDQNEENIDDDDDDDIDEINNINSSSDANDTNEKSFISDIDSERDGIRDDFVCSDDFSSDNDF